MPKKPKAAAKPLRHLRPSDLRAVTQLATQATRGVTTMSEGVHQAVWSSMGASSHGASKARARGITGFVYRAVHGVTELVGRGLQAAFTKMEPLLENLVDEPPETYGREAVLAALNGVMGDQLAQNHNPLATPMTLRWQGNVLNPHAMPPMPGATGKVLLLIHGLCMNDLQWRAMPQEGGKPQSDHAAVLAAELGYTPIYLRYNSGLHTSQNGRKLAALLEQVLQHWPVPVEELTAVVHSMGGLIIRSATHYAQQDNLHWPTQLKNIVFLGTPHHGSPLEKAGNWVDVILATTPFSKPLAKLGQLRSAGITDLRYGHVLDADWQGRDRFTRTPDSRQSLPLPEGVACYTVVATAASKRSPLADRLIGDGLVPLASGLGEHSDPRHNLQFAKTAQATVYRTPHMALLNSPEVTAQLLQWLTPAKPAQRAGS
ncbi:lipase family alpha/beta hydrolase [Candidatus Aalborgicola defluviihabitans]|uniref:lipase family alpha/beta hydrolase n=1 Tax=Candidatus Aalborgicola defluviihabitans TaxID=3386187 RepID=UPI001EBCD1CC|nr:alpha/beta hydrolase [Burkholderiales bacterium]